MEEKNNLKSTLRNIRDGLGFLAFILIILATTIWIIVGYQNNTLNPNGGPNWIILATSIVALLLTLLTYKDLGEVMSNSENKKIPLRYHIVFSALTVIGYLGAVLTHYSLFVATPIIAISFVLKILAKKHLK
jgi:hypothetical protein